MLRRLALILLLLTCLPAPAADKPSRPVKKRDPVVRPAGVEPFGEPLSFDGEFVEVSHANTLRNRYASKDFGKDLDFYHARAAEAARGRKPGVMRLRQVFIKRFDLVGGPAGITCTIPDNYIPEAAEYEATLSRTIFAYSNGAIEARWLKPVVIDAVQYDTGKDGLGDKWWFRPKSVEEQLLPHLADMNDGDADFLLFYLHYAVRPDGTKIWPAHGGMAWGHEQIKGARLLTLNDHEIARGTHELGHHWYDTTVQETENLTITRNHGMVDAGYFADDLWDPKTRVGTLELGPVMAHYRDNMRYFYTRDMWQRWRLRPPHNLPHEPFTGKTYKWDEVRNDYWYRLPQLKRDELRSLTGLAGLTVATGEAFVVFDPGTGAKIDSRLLETPVQQDLTLNNALNLKGESAAVLKTSTGLWAFVRPPLADFYAQLPGAAVVGYVLEDQKGLIAIKLPGSVPPDEVGFFRPEPLQVVAQGQLPYSGRFRENLRVTLSAKAGTIRYTMDDSTPTPSSPAFSGPLSLTASAVVRATVFDEAGKPLGGARRVFSRQPILATITGAVGSCPPYTITPATTLQLDGAQWRVHYTLDGMTPTTDSPRYERPIAITGAAIVTAQCFDPSGQPVGDAWSAAFIDRGYERSLTTEKPITYSDHESVNDPAAAVDGFADRENGWWSKPAPTWMQVDLQGTFKVDRLNVVTYWDGGRYYQYRVEVSTDGKTWKPVVDASANTTVATKQGYEHRFAPTPARYIKITMLKNSANPGLHVVELRAWEAR